MLKLALSCWIAVVCPALCAAGDCCATNDGCHEQETEIHDDAHLCDHCDNDAAHDDEACFCEAPYTLGPVPTVDRKLTADDGITGSIATRQITCCLCTLHLDTGYDPPATAPPLFSPLLN